MSYHSLQRYEMVDPTKNLTKMVDQEIVKCNQGCQGVFIKCRVIKCINPVNFWASLLPVSSEQCAAFKKLENELNNYYNTYEIDTCFPFFPAKGEIIVIKSPHNGQWLRGEVEAIIQSLHGYQVKTFLVDYAESLYVDAQNIRPISDYFKAFQFQALHLTLPNLSPFGLQIIIGANAKDGLEVKNGPLDEWNESSIIFVQKLIKDHISVSAEIIKVHSPTKFDVKLLWWLPNLKEPLNLNDYLVSCEFATVTQTSAENVIQNKCNHEKIVKSEPKKEQLKSLSNNQIASCMHEDKLQINFKLKPVSNHLSKEWQNLQEKLLEIEHRPDDTGENKIKKPESKLPFGRGRKFLECQLKSVIQHQEQSLSSIIKSPASAIPENDFSDVEEMKKITARKSPEISQTIFSDEIKERIAKLPMGRSRTILESFLKTSPPNAKSKASSLARLSPASVISQDDFCDDEEAIPEQVQMRSYNDVKSVDETVSKNENIKTDKVHLLKDDILKSDFRQDFTKSKLQVLKKTETLRNVSQNNDLELMNMETRYNSRKIGQTMNNSDICQTETHLPAPRRKEGIRNFYKNIPHPHENNLTNVHKNNSSTRHVDIQTNAFFYNSQSSTNFKNQKKITVSQLEKNEKEIGESIENHYLELLSHDIIVFGENLPKPCVNLNEIGFDFQLKKHLKELQFPGPSGLQSHVMPALLRFRHMAIIGPSREGKIQTYLIPLLSSILQPKTYAHAPTVNGPLLLILCAQLDTAKRIFDTCKLILSGDFSEIVRIQLLDQNSSKLYSQGKLINGCEILISTPCRFLELLKHSDNKILSLKRLSHLVLDEANILIEQEVESVFQILNKCCKDLNKRKLFPWQIIISGEHWTPGIAYSVQHYMFDPLICFSSFLEAIVFTDTKIQTHLCRSSVQDLKLEEILSHYIREKIVICTSSNEKAKHLQKLLNQSTLTMLLHSEMNVCDIEDLCKEWKSLNSGAILIIVDQCLPDVNSITDAFCLIHYDLPPSSKTQFANRFRCILQRLKKNSSPVIISDLQVEDEMKNNIAAHIILTESCGRQAQSVVDLLDRLKSSESPVALRAFAHGNYKGKEDSSLELCPKWKAFGVCLKQNSCEYRHNFHVNTDAPIVPADGQVKVLVTHVADASCYYVRLLEHTDPETKKVTDYKIQYLKLWSNLKKYYKVPENCVPVKEFIKNETYAIRSEENDYYRIKILHVLSDNEISVRYVDSGKTAFVKISQLLKLPDELKKIPSHVVEVYLCDIKPVDNGFEWQFHVNQFVHNLILGKELLGKVMLAAKSTLWLEPLVKNRYLEDLKIYIREYSVRSELKKQNYAIDHPDHLNQLQKHFNKKFPAGNGTINKSSIVNQTQPDLVNTRKLRRSELLMNCDHNVQISAVNSPGSFFVQRLDLINEFEEIKKVTNTPEPPIISEDIIIGNLYLVPFPPENLLFRSRIDSYTNNEITAFSLDYGDFTTVTKDKIHYLDEKYIELFPAQAIECSLYGIKPSTEKDWNEDVGDAFWDMVIDADGFYKTIQLKVINILDKKKDGKPIYEVLLYDDSNEKEKLLNEKLVAMGLAENTVDFSLLADNMNKKSEHMTKENIKNEDDHVCKENEAITNLDCQKLSLISDKTGFPANVLWYQTKTEINLKILVCCKEYTLIVDDERIHFNTIEAKNYVNDLHLFAKIVPNSKKEHQNGQYISINFKKLEATMWPRLLKTNLKMLWLKTDFEQLNVSDSDDDDKDQFLPRQSGLLEKSRDIYHGTILKQDSATSSEDDDNIGDSDSNCEDDNLKLF